MFAMRQTFYTYVCIIRLDRAAVQGASQWQAGVWDHGYETRKAGAVGGMGDDGDCRGGRIFIMSIAG